VILKSLRNKKIIFSKWLSLGEAQKSFTFYFLPDLTISSAWGQLGGSLGSAWGQLGFSAQTIMDSIHSYSYYINLKVKGKKVKQKVKLIESLIVK
jgi:hypothetical protein